MKLVTSAILSLIFTACANKSVDESHDLREPMRSAIRAPWGEYKKCYDNELTKNPELEGKIVVEWFIDNAGKPSDAKVISTTLNNKNVEDCVVQIIMKTQFPPAPTGAVVQTRYPFLFKKNK